MIFGVLNPDKIWHQ